MHNSELVSSFAEIAREKGIDRDSLQIIVEDVFRAMIRKRYGADDSFEIIFNPDHGDIQILHIREVVPNLDLEDPVTEIEFTDALEMDPDFEIGDEVANEVNVARFGRRAVMTARQTFSQRIRDIEKENIYQEYSELIGEIVVGEIYQTRRREVLVIHNRVELVLPREEQIYKDRYRKGDMLRAVVKEVRRDAGSSPQVIISRADPVFMERLFELEVPEIYDGIVEIKRIVREPGERAKVAVVSHDERIDPVGACVGVKGVRIHAVVRELGNENIDVLEWADDPHKLIGRALSPATPLSVHINEDLTPPRAKVVVRADEVSQAIGRGGINIRLASRMCGYEIDVYREILEEEEDIDIEEFGDAFSTDTLERLRNIGCDTAKQVLELSVDELARRSGLEKETAVQVIYVIRQEFEQDEQELRDEYAQDVVGEAAESTPGEKEAAAPEVSPEPENLEPGAPSGQEEDIDQEGDGVAADAPAEEEEEPVQAAGDQEASNVQEEQVEVKQSVQEEGEEVEPDAQDEEKEFNV